MSREDIPASIRYHCNVLGCHCGPQNRPMFYHLANALNGYLDDRPAGWVTVEVVGDMEVKKTLACPKCWESMRGGLSHKMELPEVVRLPTVGGDKDDGLPPDFPGVVTVTGDPQTGTLKTTLGEALEFLEEDDDMLPPGLPL